MTDRHVVLAWVAMTLILFTYQGITAFLPTYLIDVKGLAQGTASVLYGVFYASGAVSQWFAGNAADRYGERTVLATLAAVGVFTVGLLPFVGGTASLAALLVLLGTRLGIGPVGNGYVAALLPDEIQGAGYGLFRTFYLAVGALGSLFVGVLAERGLFDESFLILAAVTAASSILYMFLPTAPASVTIGSASDSENGTDGGLPSTAEPGSDTDGESDQTTD